MNTRTNSPSIFTPDPDRDHILGPNTAGATLIEYGDYECPACQQAHPAVKILISHFGNDLRFVFRNYPLREMHAYAEMAAEAAEAAGAQNKFWPFHDSVFERQQHLDAGYLDQCARQLGLDMPRFEKEVNDEVYRPRVQDDLDSGDRAHIRGTPSFFLNGEHVDTSFGLETLQSAIEDVLDSKKK